MIFGASTAEVDKELFQNHSPCIISQQSCKKEIAQLNTGIRNKSHGKQP